MFHRLVSRRRLFADVIVQMALMVKQIWTRVELQDLVDVLVNGVMTQMKPVQVNFVQHRLHRQMEHELQTTQASEAIRNAIFGGSKCESICRLKKEN